MSDGARADIWQEGEEEENREERPTERGPRGETNGHSHGSGGKNRKEEGVVKPAERFRVYDAELYEQAQREVQEEQDYGGVEKRERKSQQALWVFIVVLPIPSSREAASRTPLRMPSSSAIPRSPLTASL
jgi:hypothetical protein